MLLGHSLGGYLAAAYALKYPQRIHHLILADPWGFPEIPSEEELSEMAPKWVRTIAGALQKFNPLAGLRFVGPLGRFSYIHCLLAFGINIWIWIEVVILYEIATVS